MQSKLFLYNIEDTFIHRLSGLTKLVSFLFLTSAVMFSYDIRVVLAILIFSVALLKIAKIKFEQIKIMIIYVLIFLIFNEIITFLFSPEEGVKIYGTRHVILQIYGRYNLTLEQLLYQTTKFFKYISVIPLGIIFILTTNPSELASSLNKVGVNYKLSFAVALTLRYFPDVQRDYMDISLAQQARGIDLSYKAKFKDRFKNALFIIIPLIFSTLDRIEHISNAMDLRGFGKYKTRIWYTTKKMGIDDYFAIFVSLLIFVIAVLISIFVNHSRFYNPFI
ncbi:energy-coupling factor transporter transmembrane component T [Thermoanaerobacterium sp. RBIITD]|uniref:energy-coupling factor transporter transmembrane component T family protein n=1 Tax=Thermoanaerobacterium sp. RBIITD TaxID=1550240 RepID=UPI000BB9AEBA|nr:energy-coupling factor transporter transmembrane component T [Thermoanaerobacterium sp. RBIITD]SNX52755.1 energy-coupling factor transport system permease protein [Thermoanaerobacterium sp. RBIITD]